MGRTLRDRMTMRPRVIVLHVARPVLLAPLLVVIVSAVAAAATPSQPREPHAFPMQQGAQPAQILTLGLAKAGAAAPQTAPAGAAVTNSFSSCGLYETQYYLCFWTDAGYSGTLWEVNTAEKGHDIWREVLTDNDTFSSGWNFRPDSSLVGKDYPPSQPDIYCLASGWALSNFSGYTWPDGTKFNDSISSYDMQESNDC